MSDPRKLASEKKTYIGNWLSQAKAIADAVPKVQQQLELASWETSALSAAPDEIITPLSGNLNSSLCQDLEIVKRALPQIPEIDLRFLSASTGSTAATAAYIYTITDQARWSVVVPISEWGSRHSNEYLALQDRLEREGEVLNLLSKLKPSLGNEFKQASNDVKKCLANNISQTSAGIAMRNVLEHFKGELFELARKHPREQKLNWTEIADQLVDHGTPRDRFKIQEERWNYLQQRLSRLAKGHITIDKLDLKSIFAELIDHIYIILSLVQTT